MNKLKHNDSVLTDDANFVAWKSSLSAFLSDLERDLLNSRIKKPSLPECDRPEGLPDRYSPGTSVLWKLLKPSSSALLRDYTEWLNYAVRQREFLTAEEGLGAKIHALANGDVREYLRVAVGIEYARHGSNCLRALEERYGRTTPGNRRRSLRTLLSVASSDTKHPKPAKLFDALDEAVSKVNRDYATIQSKQFSEVITQISDGSVARKLESIVNSLTLVDSELLLALALSYLECDTVHPSYRFSIPALEATEGLTYKTLKRTMTSIYDRTQNPLHGTHAQISTIKTGLVSTDPPKPKCSLCGRTNHNSKDCFRHYPEIDKQTGKRIATCATCGSTKHAYPDVACGQDHKFDVKLLRAHRLTKIDRAVPAVDEPIDLSCEVAIIALAATTPSTDPNLWVIDTGATSHMGIMPDDLSHFKPSIQTVSGLQDVQTIGVGRFHNLPVTIIPSLPPGIRGLISPTALMRQHPALNFTFNKDRILLKKENKTLALASLNNGLFTIHHSKLRTFCGIITQNFQRASPPEADTSQTALVQSGHPHNRALIWHRRLGHPSDAVLKKIRDANPRITFSKTELAAFRQNICSGCALGKETRAPQHTTSSNSSTHASRRPGDLFEIDILDAPRDSVGVNNIRFALIILDASSDKPLVALLTSKSAQTVTQGFKSILDKIQSSPHFRNRDNPISNGTTIRGGNEFDTDLFKTFLQSRNLHLELTTPVEGHPNRAERAIRSLREGMLALLLPSSLGLQYWPYALLWYHHTLQPSVLPAPSMCRPTNVL
eukprot:g4884.t1